MVVRPYLELMVALAPLVAYANPAPAVVFVVAYLGVAATLDHVVPCCVEPTVAVAVGRKAFSAVAKVVNAATVSGTPVHGELRILYDAPAVATAQVEQATATIPAPANHGQMPDAHTDWERNVVVDFRYGIVRHGREGGETTSRARKNVCPSLCLAR